MSNVFFTSDTHFGHSGILRYEPEARPFSNVEDMDEKLIKCWNSCVRPRDIVWHLGDVAWWGDTSALDRVMPRLNGRKNLVMGNHDVLHVKHYARYFERVLGTFKKYNMWLSHVPIHPAEGYRAPVNVHGHLHSRAVMCHTPRGEYIEDKRYINVSVERWGLAPVSLDFIRSMIK